MNSFKIGGLKEYTRRNFSENHIITTYYFILSKSNTNHERANPIHGPQGNKTKYGGNKVLPHNTLKEEEKKGVAAQREKRGRIEKKKGKEEFFRFFFSIFKCGFHTGAN